MVESCSRHALNEFFIQRISAKVLPRLDSRENWNLANGRQRANLRASVERTRRLCPISVFVAQRERKTRSRWRDSSLDDEGSLGRALGRRERERERERGEILRFAIRSATVKNRKSGELRLPKYCETCLTGLTGYVNVPGPRRPREPKPLSFSLPPSPVRPPSFASAQDFEAFKY